MVSNALINGTKTYKSNWNDFNCLDFAQIIKHECLECTFVNLPESEFHIIRHFARELLDHVYSSIINECVFSMHEYLHLMGVILLQPNVFT